jgi:hypothetical protein
MLPFFVGSTPTHSEDKPAILYFYDKWTFENMVYIVFFKIYFVIKNYYFLFFQSFWYTDIKNNFNKIKQKNILNHIPIIIQPSNHALNLCAN